MQAIPLKSQYSTSSSWNIKRCDLFGRSKCENPVKLVIAEDVIFCINQKEIQQDLIIVNPVRDPIVQTPTDFPTDFP